MGTTEAMDMAEAPVTVEAMATAVAMATVSATATATASATVEVAVAATATSTVEAMAVHGTGLSILNDSNLRQCGFDSRRMVH